jgi:hypothetical protein
MSFIRSTTMLNCRFVVSLSLVVSFVFLCAGIVMAGEKKITKKELPGAVLSSFEKAYPKATIKGLAKEDEDGKTCFEIESLDGKTKRDILYSADGKVAEIEETVAENELPDAVRATVHKEFPTGRIAKAEKLMRGSVIEYEIHVKTGKTTHGIVVDPDGKVVKK